MSKKLKHSFISFRARSYSAVPLLVAFLLITVGIIIFLMLYTYPQQIKGLGLLLIHGDLKQIPSPATGTIEEWSKEEGDVVKANEEIALLLTNDNAESIKKVRSKVDGILAEILVYQNTSVMKNQALALLTNLGDVREDLEVIGFVSSLDGKKIKPGMKALIDPSIVDPRIHGHLKGRVKRVGKLPMTKSALSSLVKIPELAKYIRERIEAEPFVVVLSILRDKNHQTGYEWTGPGPNFLLDSGIIADISIIIFEPTLLSMLLPSWFLSRMGDK